MGLLGQVFMTQGPEEAGFITRDCPALSMGRWPASLLQAPGRVLLCAAAVWMRNKQYFTLKGKTQSCSFLKKSFPFKNYSSFPQEIKMVSRRNI